MSKTYTNTTQCCGTCANWAGPRTAHGNGYVIVESPSTKGKCYANAFCGGPQGPNSCDGVYCAKYQKWGALR